MTLLSSLIFAVSANMDNIAVGLSYGIKNIKVGLSGNLIIAFITCISTVISMLAGKILFIFVSPEKADVIGGIILIIIGLYSFIKTIFEKDNKDNKNNNNQDHNHTIKNCISILNAPEKADLDKSGTIDAKESVLLALGLSLNNIGLGIGAGITGLNIYITAFFTFIFSILTIYAGCYLGEKYLSKILGRFSSLTACFLIIALGLFEICLK